jgi:hypothetical protein
MKNLLLALAGCSALFLLTGCQTSGRIDAAARARMLQEIANEPPGNYFIGRRYYKTEYKFWGYVRKPGEPWSSAQMVMLNENTRLAPDREAGKLGSDNGTEYKLLGSFSGDKVYEPASNGIYPEFVLTGYQVRSTTPAPIFLNNAAALAPERRVILKPY